MNVLRTAEARSLAHGLGLERALTGLAGAIGLGVMAAGLLVLIGWAFDIQMIKHPVPDQEGMKPNTAAGFVLVGISLYFSLQWDPAREWPRRAWLSRALAGLVGALGLLTLGEYGWGWDLGIDQALFADSAHAVATAARGQMSPVTAINFSGLATALLMLDVDTRTGLRPSNWLALGVIANCYLALLDYLYGAPGLYWVEGFTPLPLPSALLFMALSLGLFCARPGARFVGQIGGTGIAGVASRRLLPAALLIPAFLGWLHWRSERAGFFSGAFGLALFTAVSAAIFVALISWHAHHLEQENSAREQALRALRDSEWRFRATFENAAIGIALASPQGRFFASNSALCAIVGYSREELQSLTFQQITHPDDLATDLALVEQLVSGEIRTYTREKRYIRKDRSPVWINLTTSLVRTEVGEPDYFVASIEDISARKSAETTLRSAHDTLQQEVAERTRQLQDSNTRLLAKSSLVEAIHGAQSKFIAGANSNVVFDDLLNSFLQLSESNYGFLAEIGQPKDDQSSIAFLAISDVSSNPSARQGIAQFPASTLRFAWRESLFGAAMTSGTPVMANDVANDTRRGGIPRGHPPLTTFLGLPLSCRGQLVGLIGLANRTGGYSEQTVADLETLRQACANLLFAWRGERDRQTAEVALINRTAELDAANKELETFAYSVAHDLRAPLRSIDGFAQVLVDDYAAKLDEEGRDSLQRVRDAAHRMGNLIDDLLALSRITLVKLEMEEVDLSALAQAAVAGLRQEMPEREVAVSIAPGVIVRGDPQLLAIVITNLLGNAWKFTGKRPAAVITFDAEREAGELRCHVRDNGAGFDMAGVGNLFEPFKRLHKASEFPGTGIGLATTKRIIARHGGRVWAEGVVGQGAVVSFSLPAGPR